MIDIQDPPAETQPVSSTAERLASRILNGPLAIVLGILAIWEFITWAPNYLTWPLWADHDVFATAARAWHGGMLPYRDFRGNNFPGTIYVFYILGKLFGWGKAAPFYAFDAATVGVLGLVMLVWSRRRLGDRLPAMVGYGCFLGYYLNLDYSQAAQRDWHGPFFVVTGMLLIQAWPGRISRIGAGFLSAIGLVFRPQAILLLPAQAFAVIDEARRNERSVVAALLEWGIAGGLGLFLGFLPLVLGGIWPDFLHALKVVKPGANYNLLTPQAFAEQFAFQLQPMRIAIVPLTLLLLAPQATAATRRVAGPWLVALAGVLLYRPMSPHPHAYLTHPLMLIWSILAALLVQMVLDRKSLPSSVRLGIILLVVGLGVNSKPRFCNLGGSIEAYSLLKKGVEPGAKPTGYTRNPDVVAAAYYEWKDYRELLQYLRSELGPDTKIANCLKQVPALTGPTARMPALPAESVAWLLVVRGDEAEERAFADYLTKTEDSVVVWSPAEDEMPHAPKLKTLYGAVEANYRFARRFGTMEVWTRKPPASNGKGE